MRVAELISENRWVRIRNFSDAQELSITTVCRTVREKV